MQSMGIANKEEFMEFQRKLMEQNKIKHQTDGRIQLNERGKRRDELTLRELDELSKDTRVFSSVGKMFLLTPHNEIRDNLNAKLGRINKELDGLYKQQSYTERKIKETEEGLKELMILNAVKGGKK
mmetsp:Transcript_35449/g.60753  ORF Transcript_35449/g.60753 Transcript_35449/m.60753 type:complete len:126 (+) Transcript_35449:64-441(+)